MKKINISKLILSIFLLTGTSVFVSCEKELENVLKNDTYSDAFWKNQSDVEGAINGTYGLFRNALNNNQAFFVWGDTPIGNFVTNNGTLHSDIFTRGWLIPYYREGGTLNWVNWYKIINLANLIIEKTPSISDANFAEGQKDNLIGQAYFMRGLAYFYLTRVWGDVPLQLKATESGSDVELKGGTASTEILDLIMADAQKASSLMTWESVDKSGRRKGNKGSALALLAHASAFQNDYQKTLIYTDSIINQSANFALLSPGNVSEVFSNNEAKENIFVITQKDGENESAAHTNNVFTTSVTFSTTSSISYPGFPFFEPNYYVDKSRLDKLYSPNDKRREDFFLKFDDGVVAVDNNARTERFQLTKYTNFTFKNAAALGDLRAESNIVIFRLADIILLKSEALFQLGRLNDSQNTLNIIRQRAGLEPVSANLNNRAYYTEILKERQRELIGEGHNYFDIVRNIWKKNSAQDFQFNPTDLISWNITLGDGGADRFAQKGYYFPIENANLNSNRLITQIPYWMGKY
ncbi:RagB/SusD family nutrient uptake outer membrane protein [Sphingobacterium bovistauri]|uniref:RagB/SusD family nutrient uptake outer membrane protein n=1 Tax=Sphingobacterium bovistauri TaxID=2781959 RepID=A0ABS7Z979_9SPHI|nr:RagB/SusD family nutrient uptake outer membrane protein [Sphingobacterium bovistauri]MCA5006750.1 RagB/SusD family nutrient uptake outer membrane protein [Sphingobacterium bovistauri]